MLLKPSVLWHVGAVAVFTLVATVYFYPALKGYAVEAGDVKNWVGVSQEISDYRDHDAEQILWTNSIFGGMPSTQIAMAYEGMQIPILFREMFTLWLPAPVSYMMAYFLGFYIMTIAFRIKPLFGILGSLAYGFSSYFIVIIEAGHITKSHALGYAPLLIAGFIFAYRWKNWVLGTALSAIFMSLELAVNHVQITYYFGFILIALGIVELIRYYKEKQLPKFAKITVGLLVAYGLALMVNIGNIRGTLEYTPYTMRGGAELTPKVDTTQQDQIQQTDAEGGLSTEYITNWSYGKSETFTLLVPNFKGGYSRAIGSNPDNKTHTDKAEAGYRQYINQSSQYWGDQPGTSGPVYVGAIVFLLAILSLVYVKDRTQWALLAVTILAILLSWGKNFLWFTEFFLDFFPMYNKFRTVTMILVVVELCLPLLAIIFLNKLYKSRDEIAKNIKPFLYVCGGTLGILILMVIMPGVFNTFISAPEQEMLDSITDPAQSEGAANFFGQLEVTRTSIFKADVWRSFAFVLFGSLAIYVYLRKLISANAMGIILGILVLIDLVAVDKRYLGTEKKGSGYAQWQELYKRNYPFEAHDAENRIFAIESASKPELMALADSAMNVVRESFTDEMKGSEKQRYLDQAKFRTLNRNTHFRVYEAGNMTSSAYVPYFFKGIGGYHGAKLSRYQELIENQLAANNKAVFNMLNTKYVVSLQTDQRTGEVTNSRLADENKSALGNAWFVKSFKVVPDADAEMAALNVTTTYEFEPFSMTPVRINGVEVREKRILNGTELIDFIDINVNTSTADFALMIDTVPINQPTLINEGEKVCLIKDDSMRLQWIYNELIDSADTITNRIFTYENLGSEGFKPAEEAVINQEFAANFSEKSYSASGTIDLVSYHPDELVYASSSADKQLAVFSEIYYPVGWKAFVDDEEVPISRVNYVLRAIEVPSGDHTIRFAYELDSYKSSGWISWSAMVFILLATGYSLYLNKQPAYQENKNESEAA